MFYIRKVVYEMEKARKTRTSPKRVTKGKSNKSESSTITIRVDKDLKEEAAELFEDLGMNTSTAINTFLRQSVRENKVPFEIKRNIETENALREVKEGHLETFENFDEFWEDLNED